MRQRLVLDVNQVKRILGDVPAGRGDADNWLALEVCMARLLAQARTAGLSALPRTGRKMPIGAVRAATSGSR